MVLPAKTSTLRSPPTSRGRGPRAPGAPSPKENDGRVTFNASQQIFSQGEPGGDLFFIEDGIVEIFQNIDGQEIVLHCIPGRRIEQAIIRDSDRRT